MKVKCAAHWGRRGPPTRISRKLENNPLPKSAHLHVLAAERNRTAMEKRFKTFSSVIFEASGAK